MYKLTNEEVLKRVGEERTELDTIIKRTVNCIRQILSRVSAIKEKIEGLKTIRKDYPMLSILLKSSRNNCSLLVINLNYYNIVLYELKTREHSQEQVIYILQFFSNSLDNARQEVKMIIVIIVLITIAAIFWMYRFYYREFDITHGCTTYLKTCY